MRYYAITRRLVFTKAEVRAIINKHEFKNPQVLVNLRAPYPGSGLPYSLVITPTEYHLPTFLLDSYEPQLKLVRTFTLHDDSCAAFIDMKPAKDTELGDFLERNVNWELEEVNEEHILLKGVLSNA